MKYYVINETSINYNMSKLLNTIQLQIFKMLIDLFLFHPRGIIYKIMAT